MSEITHKCVLVAEDENEMRSALATALTNAGYAVKTAPNGSEALSFIKEQQPDLILLDIMMPEIDGWELLSNPEVKKSKVVIISNLEQDSEKQRAIELGAHDYLVKSNLTLKEIVEKVSGYLS